MGTDAAPKTTGQGVVHIEVLIAFARLMRERHGADVYLFGSRARGTARPDSDYDVVVVSEEFGGRPWHRRCPDWGELWSLAGGWRIGLDLHCFTPAEFREELDGLGYLGQAKARGELVRIRPPARRPRAARRSA